MQLNVLKCAGLCPWSPLERCCPWLWACCAGERAQGGTSPVVFGGAEAPVWAQW